MNIGMDFIDPDSIAKFIDIAILSKSKARIKKEPDPIVISIRERQVDALVIQTTTRSSQSEANIPNKGLISFSSFNIDFEFSYQLVNSVSPGHSLITFPEKLRYADKRKCARLLFDTRENKIMKLWCERSKIRFSAMLYDLCTDGMGFYVIDQDVSIRNNDTVYLDETILGKQRTAFVKICHVKGTFCGGYFQDATDNFKITLKKDIYEEILWRSEQHLRLLKEKSDVIERIQIQREDREKKKESVLNYLDLINPFLDSVITVLDQFLHLAVKKENLEFKAITTGRYDATTFINCNADSFQFQFFLCLEEAVLLSISERLTGIRPAQIDDSARDLLGELGNMIVGNAKKDLADSLRYHLSTPGLIIGKRHVLSTLARYPAIRIAFSSEIGPLDIVLFVSDVIRKARNCDQFDMIVDPHDAMHFVEPIYNSTINIFANFLDISLKEKSITMRNPLTPKFEVTAFLHFNSHDLEGQVVLNMTEKLALSIYKQLVNEEITELNEDVKDAVGEILNMITGNAKEEFCQSGLHYQMSTPFVVIGRDQFIKTIGDIPFISSMYWTSAGFFELSFSLYTKKN